MTPAAFLSCMLLVAFPAVIDGQSLLVEVNQKYARFEQRSLGFVQASMSTDVKSAMVCPALCSMKPGCNGYSLTENEGLRCDLSETPCVLKQNLPAGLNDERTKVYISGDNVCLPDADQAFKFDAVEGVVPSPIVQFNVSSAADCGNACRSAMDCPGYSVTTVNPSNYTCKLAPPAGGDLYWKPDSQSSLFMEMPTSNTDSYTLLEDGRFYRVYTDYNMCYTALQRCNRQGGSLMSFYPKERTSVLVKHMQALPGFNISWKMLGTAEVTPAKQLYFPPFGSTVDPSVSLDQPWNNNAVPTLNEPMWIYTTFTNSSSNGTIGINWNTWSCGSTVPPFYSGCVLDKDLFKFKLAAEIDDPASEQLVKKEEECGRICKLLNLAHCMGFSTTLVDTSPAPDGGGAYMCKIPKPGELFWTPSTTGKLYTVPPLLGSSTAYTFAEDGRYYLVKGSTPLNQNSAQAACGNETVGSGTLLATPYPAEKRLSIFAKLLTEKGKTSAWVGGRGRQDGTLVVGLAGQGIQPNFTDPDQGWDLAVQKPPQPLTESHCLALKVTGPTTAAWVVELCNKTMTAYICEMSPPYFQIPATGKRYKVSTYPKSNVNYAFAEQVCQREGANLANTFGNTLDLLKQSLKYVFGLDKIWVCGSDYPIENQWVMCDGKTVIDSMKKNAQIGYQQWGNGYPSGGSTKNNLQAWWFGNSSSYKWVDVSKTTGITDAILCEMP